MAIVVNPGGGSDSRIFLASITSDQTLTSESTTLQNITGLGVELGASSTEVWNIEYWLLVNAANATMDVKFGFSVPASCTVQWGPVVGGTVAMGGWGGATAASTVIALRSEGQEQGMGTLAGNAGITLGALAFGGGTAGTLQLKTAQNTSDAGALKILKGSAVKSFKVRE